MFNSHEKKSQKKRHVNNSNNNRSSNNLNCFDDESFDEEVNYRPVTAIDLGLVPKPIPVNEPNFFDDILACIPSPEIFQAAELFYKANKREKLQLDEELVPKTSIIRDVIMEKLGKSDVESTEDPLIEEVLSRKRPQVIEVSASISLSDLNMGQMMSIVGNLLK